MGKWTKIIYFEVLGYNNKFKKISCCKRRSMLGRLNGVGKTYKYIFSRYRFVGGSK